MASDCQPDSAVRSCIDHRGGIRCVRPYPLRRHFKDAAPLETVRCAAGIGVKVLNANSRVAKSCGKAAVLERGCLHDRCRERWPRAAVAKTLNISNVLRGIWFHRPHNAEIEYLNIADCKDSTIYVTARIRYCLITGCESTTIILGGVSTICTTHNCEKVSVHVAAHCYKMENCIDTSAYLYCHIPPIITGDTRGIKLAPYNVLHSHMASVLHGSQMTLDSNFVDVWAYPICCTAGQNDTLSRDAFQEEQNTTYHFVHPSKFFPVVVPETGPRGVAPQLVLPEVYDRAMKERQEEIRQVMNQLKGISNETAQRKAQERIQSCFKDWLHSTGKVRQLSDLAKFAAQFQQRL